MKPKHPALADVLGQPSTDKRIDILRRLAEVGSISEAARQAGVSYKAGWQAIETLSNLAGTAMVEKAVGGSGGGGAVLTAAGRRVLDAATRLDSARAEVLAALELDSRRERGTRDADIGLAALALRTSMRNQFPCTVKRLLKTGGLVRIELEMPLGGLLYARITRESAQLLALAPGLAVLALCKATAVRVAPHIEAAPGRNLLPGKVVRASRSLQGGELALALAGGVSLVGFSDAGQKFKLHESAMACLDESAVVLALKASI